VTEPVTQVTDLGKRSGESTTSKILGTLADPHIGARAGGRLLM
jgi:hypothetical protein